MSSSGRLRRLYTRLSLLKAPFIGYSITEQPAINLWCKTKGGAAEQLAKLQFADIRAENKA